MQGLSALNISAVARTLVAQTTQALMRTVGLGLNAGDTLAAVTGADAATTMAANTRYDVDMSAWATADRNYTLPTNAAVGDEIEVYVQIGNASFELLVKTGAGQTCAFAGSTIAAATEITRVFITGERMRFRYQATNIWECVLDRRVRQQALLRLSTSATNETAATYTLPTSKGGAWTADVDNASITTVSTGLIKTRRAGNFIISIAAAPVAQVNDQASYYITASKNGTTPTGTLFTTVIGSLQTAVYYFNQTACPIPLATDDTHQFMFRTSEGARGMLAGASPAAWSFMSLTEIL